MTRALLLSILVVASCGVEEAEDITEAPAPEVRQPTQELAAPDVVVPPELTLSGCFILVECEPCQGVGGLHDAWYEYCPGVAPRLTRRVCNRPCS